MGCNDITWNISYIGDLSFFSFFFVSLARGFPIWLIFSENQRFISLISFSPLLIFCFLFHWFLFLSLFFFLLPVLGLFVLSVSSWDESLLISNFSFFLVYELNARNSRSSDVVSHKFWYIIFSFSFNLISLGLPLWHMDDLEECYLFPRVWRFPYYFSVIVFLFKPIAVGEHILYGFSSFRFFEVFFPGPEHGLSWCKFLRYLKRMCILLFRGGYSVYVD